MTRLLVRLSTVTGLPLDALAGLDGRTLATYLDVLGDPNA